MFIKALLSKCSKKLSLSVLSVLMLTVGKWLDLGISEEQMIGIAGVAMTYIAGQSAVDVKKVVNSTTVQDMVAAELMKLATKKPVAKRRPVAKKATAKK